MHGSRPRSSAKPDSRAISIRIARDPNDLMLVTAIRAAVYLAEQDCPMEEACGEWRLKLMHPHVVEGGSLSSPWPDRENRSECRK